MEYKNPGINALLGVFGKYTSMLMLLVCALSLSGCKGKTDSAMSPSENTQAKKMLQGIWLNEDADDVAFRVKGDTIYYPDSTSSPMYFYICSDTLVMKGANEMKYPIVKQAAHLFEFKNQGGDIIKLVKTLDPTYMKAFQQQKPVALNQNTLIKRDTIVGHGEEKFHLYVQVNPTSFKVYKSDFNDDGVQVENVYYDNIVNVNIFRGATKVFSRDFHKKDFEGKVPESFLSQAVLSDLVFDKIDNEGIHYLVILAQPDSYLSYQVKVVISFNGRLKIQAIGA